MDGKQVRESGETPLENARLKALHAHDGTSAVLADDVALFVDAMDGKPGLRLKAWAMSIGGWPAAREALSSMDGSPASFVIGVAICDSGQIVAETETRLEGTIRACSKDADGPGVEPCFVAFGSTTPLASLHGTQRDRYHYRHLAWASVLPALRQLAAGEDA